MNVWNLLEVVAWLPMALALVSVPLLAYVVVRWRDDREGRPRDPDLAAKLLLGLFLITALHLALVGLAGLFGGAFQDMRIKKMNGYIALVLVGALLLPPVWLLLRRTNHQERPTVIRMYWGISTIVSGLAAIASLTGFIVAALEDDLDRDFGQSIMGVGLIYVPAWILQLLRLAKSSSARSSGPSGDKPAVAE